MIRVIDFINTNRDRYVTELKEYLAIPSISALPAHTADVKACAEWTASEMRRIGLEKRSPYRHARQSRGLRRLAACGRRADDALLRPLRRAAGGFP